MVRPARNSSNEQTFMNGGENSNYGAMFANKMTVDCP